MTYRFVYRVCVIISFESVVVNLLQLAVITVPIFAARSMQYYHCLFITLLNRLWIEILSRLTEGITLEIFVD